MDTLGSQAEEWKTLLRARLPKVELPCRYCRKQTEIQFDPPEKCPHCDAPFLGKPLHVRRILTFLFGLFFLAFGCWYFYALLTGKFASEGLSKMLDDLLQYQAGRSLFFIGIVVVIVPFILYTIRGIVQILLESITPTSGRDKWVRYANAVVNVVPIENRLATMAWLYARSLLAPSIGAESTLIVYPVWQNRHELSRNIESLLCDLLWVDTFLDCARGNWNGLLSASLAAYGSDSPALMDFVARVNRTDAANTKSGDWPLLKRIAVETPSSAPQLKQSLNGSNLAFSQIHDAARRGDLVQVQALLAGNPDLILSKDDAGDTPLHYSASAGKRDLAEFLLASHADVNARDNNGCTPLHQAAMRGDRDVADWLLANKANVNAKDNRGDTPFHAAASCEHWAVVGLLRQHGGHDTLH